MPTSRTRRPRRPRKPSSTANRRISRSDAALMGWVPLVQAVDQAERRGDAAEALRLMLGHPEGLSFWRPRRYTGVLQLVMLDDLVPGWGVSRWVLAQAAQFLGDPRDAVARHRIHRALAVAVELRGGIDRVPGRDLVDRQCQVLDHDWVFRQLLLHDLGGLQQFLRRVATPDLLAGADRVAEWVGRPMGAYRLVGSEAGRTCWGSLAGGTTTTTADIGSAVGVGPGDCVIGRMVPIEDGLMFEAAPLPVPEEVALAVARDPADWLEALRAGPPGLTVAGAERRSQLLTDVPDVEVWSALGSGAVVARTVLGHAAAVSARDAGPSGDPTPWSVLVGVLLEPVALRSLGRRRAFLAPAERDLLASLGVRLAEPAGSWCRLLAQAPSAAA